MEGIIEIVKPLEDSSLLLKGVNETFQNEANQHVTWNARCKFIRKYFTR